MSATPANLDTSALPPELQQRLANIVEQAKAIPKPQAAAAAAPAQPAQPAAPKPPSLMDHIVAMRQENQILHSQLHAIGSVVEATGQAVGEIYNVLCAPQAPAPDGDQY